MNIKFGIKRTPRRYQKKVNIHSIRTFLLINLLLSIAITTSLTIVGNYYLDKKNIQEHVDSLLVANLLSYSNIPSLESLGISAHEQSSHELGWRIVQDDVYIMLLTFPISGLLIWFIIGRGLRSLDEVANEVANRKPGHLESVHMDAVPEEIRPLVDELNHLFFRLKEGFDREKRFAADAAHELRTPLAAIKAQAQVALNTNDLHEKNTALHKLITCVNRSTHIVQQLLTMSKLVPNASSYRDKVNLSRVARDILVMLTPSALEKNIELELQETTPNLLVSGNATALGILMRNVIDNAIRYSPENTLVLVRISHSNQHVVMEIHDSGPGIPNALQSRVFERFFRVLGNKSTGSGLGLAIVQQICAMHHAKIHLNTPESGAGLTVRIEFPLIYNLNH